MNRQIVAQSLIDKFGFTTYLEIGVQRAKNFFSVNAKRKIAVDPEFKIGIQRRLKNLGTFFSDHFFEMTSDDFFQNKAPGVLANSPIDVALVDGLRTYEQVMKDFKNCLSYLSEKGFILFHDCNPTTREAAEYAHSPEEMMKKFPGKSPEWNGDVWKAILDIQCSYPDIEIFVLDCDYGVGVARRKKSAGGKLKFSPDQIRSMTYNDLEKNRTEYLNLKPASYWNDFIKSC
jgi:hypothetical protein